MIKKFQSFNEELKPETYRSAAKFLKSFGGVHYDRAKKLKDHADSIILKKFIEEKEKLIEKAKDFGTFKLTVSIERGTGSLGLDEDIKKSFSKISSSFDSGSSRPGNFWIYRITSDDNVDFEYYHDNIPEDLPPYLTISFWCIPDEQRSFESKRAFSIQVPISWSKSEDDYIFEICRERDVSVEIMHTNDDGRGAQFYFKDRIEAIRFKKLYFNRENFEKVMSPELKDIFMSFSTSDEYVSLFSKLQTLRLNLLYR